MAGRGAPYDGLAADNARKGVSILQAPTRMLARWRAQRQSMARGEREKVEVAVLSPFQNRLDNACVNNLWSGGEEAGSDAVNFMHTFEGKSSQ